MAIFTGNWTDEAGEPFSHASFPILAAGGGKVARLRATMPRRSSTQAAATLAFRNTLALWNGMLTAQQRADWEELAAYLPWSGRKGERFDSHGPNVFARCCVPPRFAGAEPFTDFPALPPMHNFAVDACTFDSADSTLHYQVTFEDPGPGDQYTGVSLHQVRPPAAERSYERSATRWIASVTPWARGEAEDQVYGPAAWDVPPGDTPRVMAVSWAAATYYYDVRTGTRI